jgi:uncharacterized protein YqeY
VLNLVQAQHKQKELFFTKSNDYRTFMDNTTPKYILVEDHIKKAIKQRRDAAEQMRAGGREELAAKEEAEAKVLAGYLPEGLSEDEVRAMIREILAGGATAMGPVMGQLMPRLRGRFDGKEANRLVREELAG